MRLKVVYIILVLFDLLVSCKDRDKRIKEVLEGAWTIDSMIVRNYEIKGCLTSNVISFYGDSMSSLPVTHDNCDGINEWNSKSRHLLVYTNDSIVRLIFNTKNNFFSDTFNLSFEDDKKNKLLKLYLCSDSTKILCTKGLFSYIELSKIKKTLKVKQFQHPAP